MVLLRVAVEKLTIALGDADDLNITSVQGRAEESRNVSMHEPDDPESQRRGSLRVDTGTEGQESQRGESKDLHHVHYAEEIDRLFHSRADHGIRHGLRRNERDL